MPHADTCMCPPCRYRRGEDLGQAPRLTVRLRPDVREFLLDHAEGARGLIERLVDQERSGGRHRRQGEQLVQARRIQDLEKQLAALQAQLTVPRKSPDSAETEQLSDTRERAVEKTENRLENYAVRFREALRKNHRARILAGRLGVKSPEQLEVLRVGYCGTRGVARDAREQRELTKLGLTEPNGRERLAGCLTVPLFTASGKLSGFWGMPLKGAGAVERVTEKGQGLLSTGPLGDELVLVDGVVEALAAFGAGTTGVQAIDLLTEAWFPTLVQKGVRKVWLALFASESARRLADELVRLGLECWWVEMPEDQESRVDLLEYARNWARALKQAKRHFSPSRGRKNLKKA